MRTTLPTKSLTYFRRHAAEMIAEVAETRQPVTITVNGKAKGVLRDIQTYEEEKKQLRGC